MTLFVGVLAPGSLAAQPTAPDCSGVAIWNCSRTTREDSLRRIRLGTASGREVAQAQILLFAFIQNRCLDSPWRAGTLAPEAAPEAAPESPCKAFSASERVEVLLLAEELELLSPEAVERSLEILIKEAFSLLSKQSRFSLVEFRLRGHLQKAEWQFAILELGWLSAFYPEFHLGFRGATQLFSYYLQQGQWQHARLQRRSMMLFANSLRETMWGEVLLLLEAGLARDRREFCAQQLRLLQLRISPAGRDALDQAKASWLKQLALPQELAARLLAWLELSSPSTNELERLKQEELFSQGHCGLK
ncbi:MAG: hypothetical protein MK135_08365 [Polyangiaceae bacterium]|nr:hypothetical protein [Polyangiaceae bacterium]